MTNVAAPRVVEILLVEDSAADARMIGEALALVGVPHRLHVVEDGERALKFLGRTDAYADSPRPDLVLLDLSLPGMHGHELLAEIRLEHPKPSLPVVVLTGSYLQKDIERSYDLHADEFITKPVGMVHYAAQLSFALRVLGAPRVPH